MMIKTEHAAQIMTWGFTGEDWRLPLCCKLQHHTNTDTSKCKSLSWWLWRKHKELSLERLRISPVERNIVRWNRRLDWNIWLLQTNLISTVWIQILTIPMFYSLNMLEIRCIQAILLWIFQLFCWLDSSHSVSWIPAILLCVQHHTWLKSKHSCSCDCTHPNTFCFKSNNLNLK